MVARAVGEGQGLKPLVVHEASPKSGGKGWEMYTVTIEGRLVEGTRYSSQHIRYSSKSEALAAAREAI